MHHINRPSSNRFVRQALILNRENPAVTTSFPKLFYAMLSHSTSSDGGVRGEALRMSTEMIIVEPACILQWRSIYEEKVKETLCVLTYMRGEWMDIGEKVVRGILVELACCGVIDCCLLPQVKRDDFLSFLKKVLTKNDRLLHHDGWSGSKAVIRRENSDAVLVISRPSFKQSFGTRREDVSDCSQVAQDLYLKIDPQAYKRKVISYGLLFAVVFAVLMSIGLALQFRISDQELEAAVASVRGAVDGYINDVKDAAVVVQSLAVQPLEAIDSSLRFALASGAYLMDEVVPMVVGALSDIALSARTSGEMMLATAIDRAQSYMLLTKNIAYGELLVSVNDTLQMWMYGAYDLAWSAALATQTYLVSMEATMGPHIKAFLNMVIKSAIQAYHGTSAHIAAFLENVNAQ